MVCIYCGSDTKVSNSRHQKRANNVWRRRQCLTCRTVFSTIEAPDMELSITVKQQNGTLTPFLRDQLLISVYESLKHRKSALADATSLTDTVLGSLYSLAEASVLERDVIATVVTTVLERFDSVAATHYKAFHPV
jgi:transcriptional repressor NrdR